MDRHAVESVIAKTVDYLDRPSVVGYEQPFFDHLERELAALGCTVDRRARVLAAWRDGDDRRILSSHIDRHGLVGTGGGEYEYAAYVARLLGGGEAARTSRRMLEAIRDRFDGEPVIAYRPESGDTLADGVVQSAYYCSKRCNLVFRIDGFEAFPIGTPVRFAQPCQDRERRFTGQLDNAISAAVVHTLFARGFTGRALFTAEEEIGNSWRHALDYLADTGLSTRSLLVLDTSPFPDQAPIAEGRVVLRRRDANGVFDRSLVDRLVAACDAEGVPYLLKDAWIDEQNRAREANGQRPLGLGSTELGRIVTGSNGAVTGTTVQLPTLGYHSNRETTSHRAIHNLLRILERVLGP